jgi:hypothetical protein
VTKDDDPYTGAGVIPKGTDAVLLDYAVHGPQTIEVPIVEVLGKVARCPQHVLDPQ